MTQTPDLLESHLQCLRASLNTLSNEAMDLAVDHELSLQLSELCSRLSDSTSECTSHSPLGPGAALDIIGQARASLDLLSSTGCSLGEKDGREGDGLAPRLRSALGELVMAAGKELRRDASARVFGLYVIIDPEFTAGRDPLEVAHGALKGGARMLQLRDKIREKGQTLPLARQLSQICAEYGALFILNDHADLASVVGSDGLHVGQGDLPISDARRILRPQQIIGRSNHLLEEVLESRDQGVDHVAIGSIYPTTTKASISRRPPAGPGAVARAKVAVDLPLVAIGGINEENLEPVIKAGADAVCVTSAVGLAPNPEEATQRLVERILKAGGRA